ncbi:MAG: 2-oxo acid dehydrogenase subunit E2 [Simkaniaceae bacterium]|nr:2-oxo acid dehydrogenase subunit E2 [Simkaniaceae bacterium]
MPFILTMPKLSPTMAEGTIVKWHKKEGDKVAEGDLLIEVATDKATVEYHALDGGYLRQILIKEDGDGSVNDPIAIMTKTQDESLEGFQVTQPKAPVEAPQKVVAGEKKKEGAAVLGVGFEAEPPLEGYSFEFDVGEGVKASPYAKKLASEEGLDLTTVKGSGPGGRIVSKDLEMAQKQGVVAFGSRAKPEIAPGTFQSEKLSPMRRAIGEKLQASKTFIPHFYIEKEIDVDSLVRLRTELLEGGVKVTYNDFVMRAVALALREHPHVNSGFDSVKGEIIRFKTIDIAVAVSLPDGLITPIVRNADYKNLGQLSVEVRHLAKCAKEGTLKVEQYKGGSFTVSNLGMYGITSFVAVINPPQAAILAVGGMREVVAIKNGIVVPSQRMNMTLSADHRVVDGADGAKFLLSVKKLLENPATLLI